MGSFLREFTEENVAQLDDISERASNRVHTLLLSDACRRSGVVYLDVDSTICEVQGRQKQGATAAWTNQVGYHPLVATRSDTSEIVMTRLRPGASQENNTEFIAEAVRRLRRCSNGDPIVVRADSGFFSYELLNTLDAMGVQWSVTTRLYANIRTVIGGIADDAWRGIGDPDKTGIVMQVAETTIVPTTDKAGDLKGKPIRLT